MVEERCDDTTETPSQTNSHPGGMPALNDAMPSTYLGLRYHLVFSTKHREPFIARVRVR